MIEVELAVNELTRKLLRDKADPLKKRFDLSTQFL